MPSPACNLHKEDMNQMKDNINEFSNFVTSATIVFENINKNITMLVENDGEKQDTIIRMLNENKHMLDKLDMYGEIIHSIEKTQQEGCPALKGAVELRKIETSNMKDTINSLKIAQDKTRTENEELQNQCGIHKEKISVANNRLKDLEDDKKWLIRLLITKGVGIVASLGLSLYLVVKAG